MKDQAKLPEPPKQRKDYDLSTENNGLGRAKDAPPGIHGVNAELRSPADLMRSLGFDPKDTMSPLEFLVAVANNQLNKVYKNKKRREKTESAGGIGLSYRIECAKTAARYIHMEMPQVKFVSTEEGTFSDKLTKAVLSGNERLRTRQMIIETVERISPDEPILEASFPPEFERQKQRPKDVTPVEINEESSGGEVGYDPDSDD